MIGGELPPQFQNAGTLANHFHLTLGEALGQGRIVGNALQKFAVYIDLMGDLIEIRLECFTLVNQLSVLVGSRDQHAAGDDSNTQAQKRYGE